MKTIYMAFFSIISSVICVSSLNAQVALNGHYVYGPQKEAFGARFDVRLGEYGERHWSLGVNYEQGKFASNPTGRNLPYYAGRIGLDYTPFLYYDDSWVEPYIGVDVEYLKPKKIVDDYRVSVYPRAGFRLFNVLFVEFIPDNLNEPDSLGRFFKFRYNSYRLLIGLNHVFVD